MGTRIIVIFFFFISPLLAQEYSPPGIFHEVKQGQTLWSIAQGYGVDILDIMKFNRLKEPSSIYAGRYLFIPGVKTPVDISKTFEVTPEQYITGEASFIWPVAGKVTSCKNGVEIACPQFSAVRASEKGVVASAGILRGYGNIIIIDHRNGYYTIYGHNERNLSSRGDEVEKGEQIAIAGNTGRTEQPCVYFEIRKGSKAVDPLQYLPR